MRAMLLLCWLLLLGAAPAEQAATLSGQWSPAGYTVSWQADRRACLMIAESAEVGAARYLLACAEAGAGTLRYTGIDINYQPRPGRVLLLVDAEQVASPPLAALTIGPGPHVVVFPLVLGQ
jgi:hypothetical protein